MFSVAMTLLEAAACVRRGASVVLLVVFWCWETWRPFFGPREGRLRHAGRNLTLALINTSVLGVAFGGATLAVTGWTERNRAGLLNLAGLPVPVGFVLALGLLDGWMYLWHRANHALPLLWRFHRMHHSDRHMDVTTATRFHLGEHIGAAALRLSLVPLLGLGLWHLVVYDTLVVAVTQLHHADVSLGRLDRWLRLVIVTPDLHKVHHSQRRAETDSNFATVLSVWDRMAGTMRTRPDPEAITFGLAEFTEPRWQGWWGMWQTPFVAVRRPREDGDRAV